MCISLEPYEIHWKTYFIGDTKQDVSQWNMQNDLYVGANPLVYRNWACSWYVVNQKKNNNKDILIIIIKNQNI